METLCATYRPALLAWLRSRGHDLLAAEDHVQGFFEHLLQREFLSGVAREEGRFRTFLLAVLQNYLADVRKRAMRAKRGGGAAPASLDEADDTGEPLWQPAANSEAPDVAFDRAWAQALLANALQQLECECARSGHLRLCQSLEPVLFSDDDAPAYAEIAAQLSMSGSAVKMAAMRIRQRLKRIIHDDVLQTVSNEQELENELQYLRTLFTKTA